MMTRLPRHSMKIGCLALACLWAASASAAITVSVTPTSAPADTTTGFTFSTQALAAGGAVLAEFYADFNGNGIIDQDDWPLLARTIVDNAASGDVEPFTLDSDPADKNIITVFNPFGETGGFLPVGAGIMRVTNSLGETATKPFAITPPTTIISQTLSGAVHMQGTTTPVPYALVFCDDPILDRTVSVSYSDGSGNYVLPIPSPGTCESAAEKPAFISAPPQTIEISAGGNPKLNLFLHQSNAVVSGKVTVKENGADTPLPGVYVEGETLDGKESFTLTNLQGEYSLPVIAGEQWRIHAEDISGYFGVLSPTHGYVTTPIITPTAGGPNTVHFTAHKETAWIEGTVLDEYGNKAVEGALLFAQRNSSDPALQPLSNGHYTDGAGKVTVGVEAGQWRVGLCMNCHEHPIFVEGETKELVPPAQEDITLAAAERRQITLRAYYADGAIEGMVYRADCVTPAPAGIRINAHTNSALNGPNQTSVGNINTDSETNGEGYYRLPLLGGSWSVQANMHDWNLQSEVQVVNMTTNGDDIVNETNEVIKNVNLCLNLPIFSTSTFQFAQVFSDAVQYDPAHFPWSQGSAFYNGKIHWRMMAVADVSGDPTNPVRLNSTPTGDYTLQYRGAWGRYSHFSVGVLNDYESTLYGGPFPAPGASWEGQTYTFSVDDTVAEYHIPTSSLQQLPIPQNVTVNGGQNPVISWDPVSGADFYTVWIYRIDTNGNPNPMDLIHMSGRLDQQSYTYPGDQLAVGQNYAVQVFANQKHPLAATNPAYEDKFLNRSSFVTRHTVGDAGNRIAGRVISSVLGHSTYVVGASVTLEGNGGTYSTMTDGNGDFAFFNVPAGSYSLTVTASGLAPVSMNIDVAATQNLVLDNLPEMTGETTATWDVDGDGKLGLGDIIRGLQILSGR